MTMPRQLVVTRIICRDGTDFMLCVPARRAGVHPNLRCPHSNHGGGSGAGGCPLPTDLEDRVDRELRDNQQESIRRRYVLIKL
ncbi:hypothetical protein J7E29_12355 [Streptomyces sp. ISL-90]|nr:hypothetical protein [Streptomyces sp. ISL-90]